jgi:ribosomal protein S18 acetylase RimI-like enzyme
MFIKLLKSNEDAKKYWELRLEALQDTPEAFGTTYQESVSRPQPINRVYDRFNEEGNYTFGVINEKEDLVGVCTLLRPLLLKEKHKAHIYAMYVTPSARKAGVGKKLVEKAITTAKEIGVEQVLLSVVTSNIPGNKLYRSLGFETYGMEKNALKDLNNTYWDENHMVLFL